MSTVIIILEKSQEINIRQVANSNIEKEKNVPIAILCTVTLSHKSVMYACLDTQERIVTVRRTSTTNKNDYWNIVSPSLF